ncbi:MAG: maleylpyruvate isomerase family mycothiol-dependent enzyme [Dehalococcoidia bacterium]
MVAAVRALADRFIYDTATVKYIALNLPEGGADRPTPGSGWTVRQVLAHLALTEQRYARSIEQWRDDPMSAHPGGDPTEPNARMAAENRATPVEEIVATFDASIRSLVSACDSVDEARLEVPYSRWPFLDVLRAWSGHLGAHAVDLVSALPEFNTDPMVLNWVLHFDFSDRPEWSEWQLKLIADLRETFQMQGVEDS